MKNAIYIILLVLFSNYNFAQLKFVINDGSDKYSATLTVSKYEDGKCSGTGTVELFDKKSKVLIQTLNSVNLFFYLNENQQPTVNVIQLYDEQSPLIFDDFNFDGNQDLAIRNGNNGSYGGPSYDVYVFNITKKQFLVSDELTTLASENLGMFDVDAKTKLITTFAKSGCCFHISTKYKVVPGKGIVKVYEFEEDATGAEDDIVRVTTRKLIKNKWISKTKKYKIKDYYPNQN
jgi:hypothetical protein